MRVFTSLAPLVLLFGVCVIACSDPMAPDEPVDAPAEAPSLVPGSWAMGSLHGDDIVRRDFEHWRPSFFNRENHYTWYRARRDFNGVRALFWAAGLAFWERRGRIVSSAQQGRVLRVKYPAGKYGARDSGVSFPWLLRGRYQELCLEYRVKFEDDFSFTTSGKLPGLCGANDNLGCYRYTGGNKPKGDDGFSVRPVWLDDDGLMGTYVYHADQAGEFGDIFVWEQGNDGDGVYLSRGEWHTIVLRVKLNDPGVANGHVEAWLDGQLVSSETGLRYRDDSPRGRQIKINEVYFNTFHGGRRASDAPGHTQYAFFDDFRLRLPAIESYR